MPLFEVKPVPEKVEDSAWGAESYRGPCWANAKDADEARMLVSGRYTNAITDGAAGSQLSPWMDPDLVRVTPIDAPPEGMSIPEGVVVAERQM